MVKEQFRTISSIQLAAILISTLIGVGVLAFPRLAVEAGDTGAPLVALASGLAIMAGIAPIIALHKRFPTESIVAYSQRLIGRWPARLMSLLTILFFMFLTGLGAREFAKVVATAVLQQTPTSVLTFTMLFLAALASRNNWTTFAYTHLFYLPLILGPVLIIAAMAMGNAEAMNALPLLPPFDWKVLLFRGLTLTALYQGFFILPFALPAMQTRQHVWLAATAGVVVPALVYGIVALLPVAVFGAQEVRQLMWPTLELAKATSVPGEILERLDAAFLMVWVTAVFTTLYSTYFLVVQALSELFHIEDHRVWSFALLPLVFLLAMLPIDIASLYRLIEYVGRIGLVLTILYPLILLLVAVVRSRASQWRVGREQ